MDVTLLGIVILFRPEQRENAKSPIAATLSGRVMDARLLQYENAKSPIAATLSGDAGQAGAAIERTIAD